MSSSSHRVLDLLLPGNPGARTGGYVYDRRIIAGLTELGWRTTVHALDPSFPQPTPAARKQARDVLAGLPSGRIVVLDGLVLGGLTRELEAQAERLRLVALIHHPLALETGLDATAARRLHESERAALALARRVIVTSRWTSRALAEYGVAAAQIRVVEPGIDSARRARSLPAARAARLRPRDRPGRDGLHAGKREPPLNLLCVATLTPRKGHTVLLDALALLRDRRWHLTCAGSLTRDAGTAAAVRRQIDRLRLGPRISLLGELDAAALQRCYARSDLFVLASHLEGYGMALAEAMAHGLPVISTTAGAIPETVPDDAGLLVPPGDSRALAKALASVMDNAVLRQRLARRALAARAVLPTWRQSAQRFEQALTGLAEHGA